MCKAWRGGLQPAAPHVGEMRVVSREASGVRQRPSCRSHLRQPQLARAGGDTWRKAPPRKPSDGPPPFRRHPLPDATRDGPATASVSKCSTPLLKTPAVHPQMPLAASSNARRGLVKCSRGRYKCLQSIYNCRRAFADMTQRVTKGVRQLRKPETYIHKVTPAPIESLREFCLSSVEHIRKRALGVAQRAEGIAKYSGGI